MSFLRSFTRVMPPLVGRAGLSTSTRLLKEGKEQNYPDHVPLNTAQNALLAVGSGIMGVLDTTRGGKLNRSGSPYELTVRSGRHFIRINGFNVLAFTTCFHDCSS
jgi:hypothetical protein